MMNVPNAPKVLNAADVRSALPMRDAIEAMRAAFAQLARGDVFLPTRLRMDAPDEHGAALIMPCHSKSMKMFSLKIATVFHDNPSRGLPLVQSTVILTDGTTGTPLAVMDGASLTAIRTGAASGLATALLARRDSTTVAIIGAGVQARTQLEAVCCVRSIKRARVYCRDIESAARFADEMSQQLHIAVEPAESAAAAIRNADIICTATPSTSAVFDDADVSPGTHINAVGAYRPDMVEIPAKTVQRARVVVDHRESALEEAGDLLGPLGQGLITEHHFASELGDLILGRSTARHNQTEMTLFKSVGIAVQDLAAACRIARNLDR